MAILSDNPVLREADILECAAGGLTPYEALSTSIAQSDVAYVIEWEGAPAAYWGWRVIPEGCFAWMLSTPEMDRRPLHTARESARLLAWLHDTYPAVYVYVHIGHTTSLRWLKWLGFTRHNTHGDFITMVARNGGRA